MIEVNFKCNHCGYDGDSSEFIYDYYYDEELDDELPIFKCPKCGWIEENDDDFMDIVK